MEKVTEERLVKAGWDEKRTIDISNIKDVYQKLGLVMPMNVEKFLTISTGNRAGLRKSIFMIASPERGGGPPLGGGEVFS